MRTIVLLLNHFEDIDDEVQRACYFSYFDQIRRGGHGYIIPFGTMYSGICSLLSVSMMIEELETLDG